MTAELNRRVNEAIALQPDQLAERLACTRRLAVDRPTADKPYLPLAVQMVQWEAANDQQAGIELALWLRGDEIPR